MGNQMQKQLQLQLQLQRQPQLQKLQLQMWVPMQLYLQLAGTTCCKTPNMFIIFYVTQIQMGTF